MALKGLFIGIDRFTSPSIPWLNCANRDAKALYALFADTLGGESVLLLDAAATRDAIEGEIKKLASCDEDDIVVITFSGHGSDSNELVAYDTRVENLSFSGIPLASLSEWLHSINPKQLICILDCCYSGAVGAKAIHSPNRKRQLESAESLIKQMAGKGRLVLSACRADESAWEAGRFGHGLLTHHLLLAMQNADRVGSSGRISVFDLLNYVTEQVMSDSLSIGEIQHPVLLGAIEGRLEWPVFVRGKEYYKFFPETAPVKVTSSLQSLSVHGFSQAVIDIWANSIPALNQLQLEAINDCGLLEGNNLLVSAPTSSGKTLIGELSAVRNALERKRSIFLFPLKALVNDKLRQFQTWYGDYGIITIKATGESTTDDILPLMRGQYDVCLMTYEKFSALIVGHPHILRQVNLIVVDEVQMITDKNRGVNLEFLLTILKMRRKKGITPQVIALSAVIGDTHGFENWMEAKLLKKTERPVPLDEGIIRHDGSFRYIESDTGIEKVIPNFIRRYFSGKSSSQDLVIPLVSKLVSQDKSVIVFRATRGKTTGCANYLAEHLRLPPVRAAIDLIPKSDPSLNSQKLRKTLSNGVGFHISDLDVEERLLVEQMFRDRTSGLNVIAATTTLAMGINTPAEAVIVAGLTHPIDIPYTVAEYKNIVGRAGRLGFSNRGTSFIVAMNANEENYFWQKYVLGLPEGVKSLFLSDSADPRTLIIRVLAASVTSPGMSSDDICLFLENSFGAFQQKRLDSGWKWSRTGLSTALNELHINELVTLSDGLYHLTPLGRLAGESSLEVESIFNVVRVIRSLNEAEITEVNLLALCQLTSELEQIHFPLNRKSTQSEPHTWFAEINRQRVAPGIVSAMRRSYNGDPVASTLRAKKTVALLLWVSNMPLNKIEDTVTQFGGRFDGAAGAIRSISARACDVLPTIGRIMELLFKNMNLSARLSRLLVRLELGIPSHLAQIGYFVGKNLSRGDYFMLAAAGITSMELLAEASEERIFELLEGSKEKQRIVFKAIAKFNEQKSQRPADMEILPIFEP